jgi:hypothetical protein
MNKFTEGARENFHSRKLTRWILLTYPKTCLTLFVTVVGGLSYYTKIRANESRKKKASFENAIYSNDNLAITRGVVYNSSNKTS